MKTLSKAQFTVLLVACLPILQNCGKAKYEQVTGTPPSGVLEQPIKPQREPMGPMDVRPVPPIDTSRWKDVGSRDVPPVNETGEEPSTPTPTPRAQAEPEVRVVEVDEPRHEPVDRPDSVWMDPTYYPDARPKMSMPHPKPPVVVQPPVVTQPPVAQRQCHQGSFVQPETAVTDKLDILFVVDTSDSIFQEREQAALGIDRFISQLPSNVDYHIGVIAGHSPETGMAGELVRAGSELPVLFSKQMGMNEIRQALHAKLTKVKGDRASDGGELGLYSLDRAISDKVITRNLNQGMFRPDAGLAVIFMSDENDICSLGNYPAGVTPKPDVNKAPSGLSWERDAYKKYCEGRVTPKSVYDKLLRLKAGYHDYSQGGKVVTKPLLVSAIVYTQTPDQKTARARGDKWEVENEKGYGYLDMVALNNGVSVDINQGDIPSGLARIGQAAGRKLSLKTEFMIFESGRVDASSVRVTVDGQQVAHRFSPLNNQVNINYAGGPGSRVVVYWCADTDVSGVSSTTTSISTTTSTRISTSTRIQSGSQIIQAPTKPVAHEPISRSEPIRSTDLTCRELQKLVDQVGSVELLTHKGIRQYIREPKFCASRKIIVISGVPAKDRALCKIGNVCQQ